MTTSYESRGAVWSASESSARRRVSRRLRVGMTMLASGGTVTVCRLPTRPKRGHLPAPRADSLRASAFPPPHPNVGYGYVACARKGAQELTTRLGVRQQLLAGTGALLALRLVLAVPRTGPLLLAAEAAYLTNPRVLAGGISGQMSLAPFYRGGYSLVVAPLVAVGAGPESTYRLALALNAVLAASLAPLLYLP